MSDTSPINYLVLIDAVELLPRLFGEVIIPHAVFNELFHPATPAPVRQFVSARPPWLQIGQVPEQYPEGFVHLDAGEIEAILLAEQIGARLLLIDDRAGVAMANGRGLKVIGTIGALDAAARKGLIDLKRAFENLEKTTFRMPRRIRQQLLAGM